MAEQVENESPTTEDAPTEDTPTEDTPAVEEPPAVEVEEPNYAAQLADLTDRFNILADQYEVLVQQVADLREENADLIENVVADVPAVTDSHDDKTGDDFLDELFI